MKDETGSVAIKQILGLYQMIYFFLMDDSSENRKAKSVNKNVVVTISHNKSKDVWLNKKYLRHSMNIIKIKFHLIGT